VWFGSPDGQGRREKRNKNKARVQGKEKEKGRESLLPWRREKKRDDRACRQQGGRYHLDGMMRK